MAKQFKKEEDEKRMKEQNIILKIIRLLTEEHLLTLEEEMKAAEFMRKEAPEC